MADEKLDVMALGLGSNHRRTIDKQGTDDDVKRAFRAAFEVVGWQVTEETDTHELARLGADRHVTTVYDLGSGLLESEGSTPLTALEGEPLVREAVQSGIDVVSFSGDKLLGGPQAGLIAGRRGPIEALRKDPIYRAMRLDKVSLAGLELTLQLLLAGRGDEIPARAMMCRSSDELRESAGSLALKLAGSGWDCEVLAGKSEPGSGSAPGIYLDTFVVRVAPARTARWASSSCAVGQPK